MGRAAPVALAFGLVMHCLATGATEQTTGLTVRTDRPEAVYAKGETATFIIEMKDGGQGSSGRTRRSSG
jgi:hypothetical protein